MSKRTRANATRHNSPTQPSESNGGQYLARIRSSLRDRFLGWPLVFLIAVFTCYGRGWDIPHVYDGVQWISQRPEIKQLWPPLYLFLNQRPMVYATFALDHWLTGGAMWNQHLVNRGIHLATALVIFSTLRQLLSSNRAGYEPLTARWLAGLSTLLWVVHPLQTQSVVYLYQRFESMAGLCYVLVLWGTVQQCLVPQSTGYVVAWCAAFVGVGCKETLLTAPLAALLLDRFFFGNTWQDVVRQRRGLHVGLWASLGLLLMVMLLFYSLKIYRNAGIGEVEGATPLIYLLNQGNVILHYLRLTVYPVGQSLDCRWPILYDPWVTVPGYLAVSLWVVLTGWLFVARPVWGILVGFPLLVLAPTSSLIPIRDLMYEHRMYLPLAGLSTLFVLGAYALASRCMGHVRGKTGTTCLVMMAAIPFVLLTTQRVELYRNPFNLWTDNLKHAAHDGRPMWQTVSAAFQANRDQQTLALSEKYLAEEWTILTTEERLGIEMFRAAVELQQGDVDRAYRHLVRLAEIFPRDLEVQSQLAFVYRDQGKTELALRTLDQIFDKVPQNAARHALKATLLLDTGREAEGQRSLLNALQLDPLDAEAHYALARFALHRGDKTTARNQLQWILSYYPNNANAKRLAEQIQ